LPLHETRLQQPETGKSGLECCLHYPPNIDNESDVKGHAIIFKPRDESV
jgi:hypothetical protein